MSDTPKTQKYAGAKRATTVTLDGNLVDIAVKFFRTTRHRSLSEFIDNKLRSELRAQAPKIRKAGLKLPPDLFAK